jgi:hypothetical protein
MIRFPSCSHPTLTRLRGAVERLAAGAPLREARPREGRRQRVTTPTLLATARTDDVLHQLPRAAALMRGAPVVETPGAATPEAAAETAAICARFLDAPER